MKKKYNNYGKAMVVTFLLAVAFSVFPLMGNTQENEPPLFAQVDCIKVAPENEDKFMEFVKGTIKPLQLERVKQGSIMLWYLYKVRFTGTIDNYNYVGVTLYVNQANIEIPFKGLDVGKVLPGKDMSKVRQEASAIRDLVSSTLIVRHDFVYPESGPGDFKYLQVDYMKVKPEKEGEYWDVETNVWKPVHHEFIKAGSRVGWSFWGRNFPAGAGLDFQYITVNYLADWSKIGAANYTDAFNKAHPGKDLDSLSEKTNSSRILVKSELWEVVEKAFAQ